MSRACSCAASAVASAVHGRARRPRTGRSGAGLAVRAFRPSRSCRPNGSRTSNIAWKRSCRPGYSSPIVWGDRSFVTAAIEGEVVPGAKAVEHTIEGKAWIHPDSVAADRKHTLKVLALDAKTGKILWEQTAYEGTVYDARHRRSSFAGPTAGHRRHDGVRVLRSRGALRLRLRRQAGVEGGREVPDARPRHGHVAGALQNLVIIQRDEDDGERSVDRGLRQAHRQGGLAHEADRADQLGHAGARRRRRPHRAGDQRQRSSSSPTTRRPARSCGAQGRREQRHPHAARRQRPRHRDGRLSRRRRSSPSGPAPCPTTSAWPGNTPRALATCSRTSSTATTSTCSTDNGIVTCLDPKTGEVQVRGRPRARAGHFMGSPVAFDGYIAMTSEDGDTFMLKAGPQTRDRAHQLGRRAGVLVAGARQRAHLHSRPEASVCDRSLSCPANCRLPSSGRRRDCKTTRRSDQH